MNAPICRCGRVVPRNDDEWRYGTCSNACLRAEITVEREASLRLKAAPKRAARTKKLKPQVLAELAKFIVVRNLAFAGYFMMEQLSLFPIQKIAAKIKKTARKKAA